MLLLSFDAYCASAAAHEQQTSERKDKLHCTNIGAKLLQMGWIVAAVNMNLQ